MQKQYIVNILAPIDKAFTSVADRSSLSRWMPGEITTTLKNLGDEENPVGTKFHHGLRGFFDIDGEIIAYKKPTLFGTGLSAGPLKGIVMYHFEELDENRTKLVCDLEIMDGTKAGKLTTRTFFPIIHKLLSKHLESLKKLAEEN